MNSIRPAPSPSPSRAPRLRRLLLTTSLVAALGLTMAQAASAGTGTVTGQGMTNGSPSNEFTINGAFLGGQLNYRDPSSGRTFNGAISCLNVDGNSATIVATDPSTGLTNRTFVQDNGATGDKARNTLFNPAKLSAASAAKASACISPTGQLTSSAPLRDGEITVMETPANT